jgi:hypothetical protein
VIFHAHHELLSADRLVLPMKTTCRAAKLIEVSIVRLCATRGFEPDTYAALVAKISAGRAGVENAKATEKMKESPIAVKIRAIRSWMK